MYSPNIEKICKYCQYAKAAVGVPLYMHCDIDNGFYSVSHTCANFKYDILKKTLHRHKNIQTSCFKPEDFSID